LLLTRGMILSRTKGFAKSGRSGQDEALHALLVGLVDEGTLPQMPLPLRGFLRQDVAGVRLRALHLAGTGLLEALRSAAVRLHLRHNKISFDLHTARAVFVWCGADA